MWKVIGNSILLFFFILVALSCVAAHLIHKQADSVLGPRDHSSLSVDWTPLLLTATIPMEYSSPTVNFKAQWDCSSSTLAVQEASWVLQGHHFILSRPIDIVRSEKGWEVPRTRLNVDAGWMIIEGIIGGDDEHLQIALRHYEWPRKGFLNADMLYEKNAVDIVCELFQESRDEAAAKADIRLSVEAPLLNSFGKDVQLEGSWKLNGDLSQLSTLLDDLSIALEGKIALAGQVAGTLRTPEIYGMGTLENASFEDLNSGLSLTELKGDCHYHVKWGDFLAYNMCLDFADAKISPKIGMEGLASGRLSFIGDHKDALLEGSVEMHSFFLALSDIELNGRPSLEVKYRHPKLDAPQLSEDKLPVRLNIHIQGKQQLVIYDENLSSEWKGELTIGGDFAKPHYTGQLHLQEGSYFLNGYRWDLTRGHIQFNGDFGKKAALNLIASRNYSDITLEANMRGPLNNPSLSFYSSPPLSMREIASLLVFGRADSASDIPLHSSESLTAALTNTKGPTGGLLDYFHRFGIDQVEMSRTPHEAGSDISLRVGKYLTKDILFSWKKPMTVSGQQVSVEARLPKNLMLEAELNENKDARLNLKWRKNY